MSIAAGFSMYFLSFLPLWISVLFIDIKSIAEVQPHIWTERISVILILVMTFISLVVLMVSMNSRNKNGSQVYTIIEVKEEKAITAEFLLSYILPLFAFDFTVWDGVVQFLIFFLVLAFLSIRHSHFSVNILLELLKYRFYSCKLKNSDGVEIDKTIICQQTLSAQRGKKIRIRSLNNEYSVKVTDTE